MSKKIIIISSLLTSFLFVVFYAQSATTISTNISTSGTLTVSGDATFDTNTFYVDSTNGFVGIGTTSPAQKLDVNGSIQTLSTSWIGPSSATGLLFQDGQAAFGGQLAAADSILGIYHNDTNFQSGDLTNGLYVDFYARQQTTGNANIFAIESYANYEADAGVVNTNGTVGFLGGSMLSADHQGSGINLAGAQINNRIREGAAGSVGAFYGFRSGLNAWGANTTAITNNIHFFAETPSLNGGTINNNYGVYIQAQKTTGVTNGWGIYQQDEDDVNYFEGNTGIGTSTPWAKFSILNTTASNSFIVGDEANDTSAFTIDASGNVGIGTTSPAAKLEVIDSVRFGLPESHNFSYANSGNMFDLKYSTASRILLSTNAQFSFGATYAEQDGDAGIRLGKTGRYSYIIGGDDLLFNPTGGRVGIGTTTPGAMLQVATSTANATTTVEFGKANQNKGSCIILYDSAGTAYYCSVQGGEFTCSTSSCE